METKNDLAIIPDSELLSLQQAAKDGDQEAMLQLIDMFKDDMIRLSRFIRLPEEDAVGEMIVELLEFIKGSKA
ncbi:helix-turn-helix domain-containing protein [Paenibacillus sp. DMB20]|uniref:helix-turn-helix domain-containing protein n=1 Tax=Paenibacillus sp. DMB20 TaxID=1642570 RepID=UPI000627F16D|nr:helix-turn-helix domain-containing protein [Paenibacillus sp. DMB20]KKO54047.1 hypothetical protein XI25_08030 [Paenibacillus sp. DMB20]